MAEIRKMAGNLTRVETGPVQFGGDWPGVFIRGDDAAAYACILDQIHEQHGDKLYHFQYATLINLKSLLFSCVVPPTKRQFPQNNDEAV